MKLDDLSAQSGAPAQHDADLLAPLLHGPAAALVGGGGSQQGGLHGAIIGTLLALIDDGQTPLVSYPGQSGHAAVPARSTVDVHGPHVGQQVVLMFEHGDVGKPIIMGVLRSHSAWPLADKPATVDVDADGERMTVSAKSQLVLRCGKASITLTSAGKVLIEGEYIVSRSKGVNRVKGGSVQLN